MLVRVLGAAAGGGFPQWNCGCQNCTLARRRDPRTRPRTQDSIAVRADCADASDATSQWAIVNASPDIHAQLGHAHALHPRGPRDSPIRAIVLTNGDMDHILGLFSLRESHPLVVHATEAVWTGLTESNAMFRTLRRFEGQVTWKRIELGVESQLLPGLFMRAFAVPGKLPVHLEKLREASPEDNIGIVLREEDGTSGAEPRRGQHVGARAAYVASAGALGPFIDSIKDVAALFFDGTFWSSDELVKLELAKSRAEDMAHLPIGGEGGSLARLTPQLGAMRKIYTHINNTNPILRDDSLERRAVVDAGWEVAFDGMEVEP